VGGKLTCNNHLDRVAAFSCPACQTLLCDDCTKRTWIRGTFVDQCRTCAAMLAPVAKGAAAAAIGEYETGVVAFVRSLPRWCALAFHRSVLLMLVGLALFAAPLYWAIGTNLSGFLAITGLVLVRGLEISVYLGIMRQTADGKDEVEPPEFTDVGDDILAPLWRYFCATIPILLGVLWFGIEIDSVVGGFLIFIVQPLAIADHPGPALVVLAGLGLLPLLTIIAGYSQSALAVLHPRIWADAIRVLGASYAAAGAVYYGLLFVEIVVWVPLLLRARAAIDIPVVTTLVVLFLTYVPFAIRARILGGLVRPHLAQLA
jgi:hypothetical protein